MFRSATAQWSSNEIKGNHHRYYLQRRGTNLMVGARLQSDVPGILASVTQTGAVEGKREVTRYRRHLPHPPHDPLPRGPPRHVDWVTTKVVGAETGSSTDPESHQVQYYLVWDMTTTRTLRTLSIFSQLRRPRPQQLTLRPRFLTTATMSDPTPRRLQRPVILCVTLSQFYVSELRASAVQSLFC